MVSDPVFVIEVLKGATFEMRSIVGDDGSGDSKPSDYISPYEPYHISISDVHQGFSLDPFGEVVSHNQQVFAIDGGGRQRSQDVHSPLGEGP